jgi:hypothetical protein
MGPFRVKLEKLQQVSRLDKKKTPTIKTTKRKLLHGITKYFMCDVQ